MLGEKVKKLRKLKRLTQNDLADLLGLSQSTIGMIEKNRQGASNDTLIKLANALDTTVDYLLSGDEQREEVNVPQLYSSKYKVTSRDLSQYTEEMKKATEAFFMNDELSDEAKKEMLDLMSELFWKAKAKNKRTSKK